MQLRHFLYANGKRFKKNYLVVMNALQLNFIGSNNDNYLHP